MDVDITTTNENGTFVGIVETVDEGGSDMLFAEDTDTEEAAWIAAKGFADAGGHTVTSVLRVGGPGPVAAALGMRH